MAYLRRLPRDGTEITALKRALQKIANLPDDADPARARRIAVAVLGGDPSKATQARYFSAVEQS